LGFVQVGLDGKTIGNLQIQSVVRTVQATFNFSFRLSVGFGGFRGVIDLEIMVKTLDKAIETRPL
jgi:hypothetical protein